MAKRTKGKPKSRKPAAGKISSHDASELAFVAYTKASGHLKDSVAAAVVNNLESPSARKIGRALLGEATQDKKVSETVNYLEKLASNRS